MNLTEARAIVSKLYSFQGKVMKPYRAPVDNFIIVPAAQQQFDEMFQNMQNSKLPLDEAVQPYKDNVAILVCFDTKDTAGSPQYCHHDYFLFDNNISI